MSVFTTQTYNLFVKKNVNIFVFYFKRYLQSKCWCTGAPAWKTGLSSLDLLFSADCALVQAHSGNSSWARDYCGWNWAAGLNKPDWTRERMSCWGNCWAREASWWVGFALVVAFDSAMSQLAWLLACQVSWHPEMGNC